MPASIIELSDGRQFERMRHEDEWPCVDCGRKKGQYHIWTCDKEPCPCCDEQLLSCDCELKETNGRL